MIISIDSLLSSKVSNWDFSLHWANPFCLSQHIGYFHDPCLMAWISSPKVGTTTKWSICRPKMSTRLTYPDRFNDYNIIFGCIETLINIFVLKEPTQRSTISHRTNEQFFAVKVWFQSNSIAQIAPAGKWTWWSIITIPPALVWIFPSSSALPPREPAIPMIKVARVRMYLFDDMQRVRCLVRYRLTLHPHDHPKSLAIKASIFHRSTVPFWFNTIPVQRSIENYLKRWFDIISSLV